MKNLFLIATIMVTSSFSSISTAYKIKTSGDDIPKLTKYNVYKSIEEAGIKYPELVFSQALLESGDFKSKLTRTNNNIFGMKLSKYRETTAIGKSKNGYAKYRSWNSSVEDYKLFQDYVIKRYNLTNYGKYKAWVKKYYSETGDYIARINKRLADNYYIIEKYQENEVLREATDTANYRLGKEDLEKLRTNVAQRIL